MGKIRVKSFDDQEQEAKDKKLATKRSEKKEQKKAAEVAEEPAAVEDQANTQESKTEEKTEEVTPAKKSKNKFQKTDEKVRSENYKAKKALINSEEAYGVSEGLKLLDQVHMAKFDETVELHINTNTVGINGSMTLPHGSGKVVRVAIADDALIAEVEKGKINFDILLANPAMMPKLAKVAKVLGPRGLMPNPKSGTVTPNPEAAAKKYEGGLLNFKTEAKAPIIHLIVGKISFGPAKLEENINTAISAVKKPNILNITLKSSMSPAIKLKV